MNRHGDAIVIVMVGIVILLVFLASLFLDTFYPGRRYAVEMRYNSSGTVYVIMEASRWNWDWHAVRDNGYILTYKDFVNADSMVARLTRAEIESERMKIKTKWCN
jgi:hypothetical protein